MQGKTFSNTDSATAAKSGVQVFGNPDEWKLLCKAWSEEQGWMKSTKAMDVEGGKLYQVTTQQKNPDGSYAIAEALAFVPGFERFIPGELVSTES